MVIGSGGGLGFAGCPVVIDRMPTRLVPTPEGGASREASCEAKSVCDEIGIVGSVSLVRTLLASNLALS
jgi:hypothetical protein